MFWVLEIHEDETKIFAPIPTPISKKFYPSSPFPQKKIPHG